MTINQFYSESYSNVPSVVKVFARGTGAGAADLTSVKGVTLIDQTGTGLYTITLKRKFKGLLMLVGNVIDLTGSDDWEVTLASDLTSGNQVSVVISKSGTAANLTSDEKLLLEISLEDTNVKPASF